MTRTALGIAFACLFATQGFAMGFEIPAQPDYSLQRTATQGQDVDRTLTTGSIKPVDPNHCSMHRSKQHHPGAKKPMTMQQRSG